MKNAYCLILVAMLSATAFAADDRPALSTAIAEPMYPTKITATGRVQSLIAAKISSRVTGTITAFGARDSQRMLDAGMRVSKGDVLFQLDRTTFENAVAVAQAAHELALANLKNLEVGTRPERIEQLEQTLAELDARIADRKRDEERFRRLVEQEKSLPARRLEEVQTELATLTAQRKAAAARLLEAKNGATPTELAVAKAQVKQAEATLKVAQNDLRDTEIKAPFAGIIARRFKSPGDYITYMPPTEVLELISLDDMEVELRLPEAYYRLVQAGKTPVTLRSSILKDPINATIARVVSDIDPANGMFAVRIAIAPDQRSTLIPGAFVTADISFGSAVQDVIVPSRCVFATDGKPHVFVAENGKMVRKAVELGDRLTEGVVVTSGLTAGQKVLIGPADAMRDGAELPKDLTN